MVYFIFACYNANKEKNMSSKKFINIIIFALTIVVVILTATACWTVSFYFEYDWLVENVVSISLIYSYGRSHWEDQIEYTVLYSLLCEEINEFFIMLSELSFRRVITFGGYGGYMEGLAIKMYRLDGKLEFLFWDWSLIMDKEHRFSGDRWIFTDIEKFNELISQFVDISEFV